MIYYYALRNELAICIIIFSKVCWCINGQPDESLNLKSNEEISNAMNSLNPVVILFYDRNCGYSGKFLPTFDTILSNFGLIGNKVECSQHGDLCDANNVTAVPTMRIYANNAKLYDHEGLLESAQLESELYRLKLNG